mgnify:CR=1 FL=1
MVLALIATVLFGLVLIGLDRAAGSDPYWAVLVLRFSTLSVIFLTVIVVGHLPIAPSKNIRRLMLLGILDISGFIVFSIATTRDFLSVVAVLGSLYPVVTIAVAWLRLGERMNHLQWVGIVFTFLGVVLVVSG